MRWCTARRGSRPSPSKALDDDRLRALQPKVTAGVDPELGRGDDDSPARIRITMTDGQVFEVRKDFSTGSHKLPMSQAQLEEKFFDCAAVVMDEGSAKRILAILNELPGRAPSPTSGRCSGRRESSQNKSPAPCVVGAGDILTQRTYASP